MLTFKSAQIHGGNGKTAVVKKPADIFYRFPGIAAKLGCCMPEDVDTCGSDTSQTEVALKVTIERAAGYPFKVLRA